MKQLPMRIEKKSDAPDVFSFFYMLFVNALNSQSIKRKEKTRYDL